MNGPFAAAEHPDISIYKSNLKDRLGEDEYVISDAGYADATVLNGLDVPEYMDYHSAVRARHEVVNWKLKSFNVLRNNFRHGIELHTLCFHAVANLTQVVIMMEEPLFDLPW